MKTQKNITITYILIFLISFNEISAQINNDTLWPINSEVIVPIHKNSFNKNGDCQERRQGGNARIINGFQVFNGAVDGDQQVDPQIAVGGGFVLHATNTGLTIYKKNGDFVQGVSQRCFNDGIDPKLFFDIHNRCFVFDLWKYWEVQNKPVNISVSETDDPTAAWNTYPIPAPNGIDGGGIGYSKNWIGYSFPGIGSLSFIFKTKEAKAGQPITIYRFLGSLGNPVFVQDFNNDDLYFFDVTTNKFIIRKVAEDANGKPYCIKVAEEPHHLKYIDYPPLSPQKGTLQKIASGDRNPKNIILQNGSIWFSQAVNYNGRSAVQWNEVNSQNGKIIQSGIIADQISSFIQTTIAVNKENDVLIGFQQTGPNSFISPRFAYRSAQDKKGEIRQVISAGEGEGYSVVEPWGDYSGSIIDGDNLFDLWTTQSVVSKKGKGETVIIKVPYKLFTEEKQIFITNKLTKRILFSAGETLTRTNGYEGGWLESPKILCTDANYYDRAKWLIEKNIDGSYFIINSETNRYLFSDGNPINLGHLEEEKKLKIPLALGSDANYYNRAMWYFDKCKDGSFLIRNKETNRYLFSTGEIFNGKPGDEGGWLSSPSVICSDDKFNDRACWNISGNGIKLINKK